jgi:hypothetical protein
MADMKKTVIEVNEGEIFVLVKLDPKGQLGVQSNVPSQITQLGMIGMAQVLIAKPKESSIVKAAAGMFSKKS